MPPRQPEPKRSWVIPVSLLILFFSGGYLLLIEFSTIQDRFASAGSAWITFVVIASVLLIWALVSLISLNYELDSLERLKSYLQQMMAKNEPDDRIGLAEDLVYTTESSEPLQFYPRIFELDARYALERLNPFSQVGVQHIPALLTALGIFFTFIGLIIGIGELDLQGSSDRLMEGMTTLLGGVGLAFRSSLAGICLSFLMLIISRVQISRADSMSREISQLATQVENRRQQDPVTVLRTMRGDTKEATNTLCEVRDHSDEISNKIGELGSEIATALSGELTNAINETIAAPLKEMNKQMLEFQREGLNTHQKTLGNILDTFLEDFQDTMGTQFSHLDASLEKTITWHENTQDMLGELFENMSEAQKNQIELLEDTKSFEVDRFAANRELFDETREYHDQRLEDERKLHNQRVVQKRSLHEETLQDSRGFHKKRMVDEKQFHQLRVDQEKEHHEQNMQEKLKLLEANNKLNDALTTTAEKLTTTIGGFEKTHRELASLVKNSLDLSTNLNQKLADVVDDQVEKLTMLQNTLQRIESVSENLPREYKALMRDMQDELHSGLGQTFEAFDGSTANVVEHLGGSYELIKDALLTLNKELNRISTEVPKRIQKNGKKGTQQLTSISSD